MADKPKRVSITTPKGVAIYPSIVEPDYGTKEYPVPLGQYRLRLRLDASLPDVKAMLDKVKVFHDLAIENGRELFANLKPETRRKLKDITVNDFFTEVLDRETEEPTGQIELNFKAQHSYKDKKTDEIKELMKPALFDSRGRPVSRKGLKVWGGSIVRVSFEIEPNKDGTWGYFIPATGAVGISTRLRAVQIIQLSEGQAKDAAGYGFGTEEDGFDSSAFAGSEDTETEDTDAPTAEDF